MKIQTIITAVFLFTCFIFLLLGLRGHLGVPTPDELNSRYWKEDGPFELSPERGRFALMYSIAQNHSVYFSLPIAQFTTPDVGYGKTSHKYVSLFAPALSYLIIPGFLIGKALGASQIGTYAMISVFAVLNAFLIYLLARSLGAGVNAARFSGLLFLFATPAFAYGVNLYQHHVSTFLILSSLYLLSRYKNIFSLSLVFFLCAFSLPLDYPNLFLMFPIGLFALFQMISKEKFVDGVSYTIHMLRVPALIFLIFPIIFFLWFNKQSYGSPFNFLGGNSLIAVKSIDANGLPSKIATADVSSGSNKSSSENSGLNLFKTRNLLNGFYIHFLSPDRGIIYFTPIVLFGIFGIAFAYKKNKEITIVLVSIIGIDVLLYSMWGDPWGGWAFGSRYLIPGYALLAIFTGVMLTHWKKKWFVMVPFVLVFFYSLAVNTLGALTTSVNPPQVEVLSIEKLSGKEEKYTYMRNYDFLLSNRSKSFVYQEVASSYMSAFQYYIAIVSGIGVVSILLMTSMYRRKEQQ